MNMLFFSAFVAIFAVSNGMLVQPRHGLEKQELGESPLCTVCELVVKAAQDILNNGETEAELEDILKSKVCSVLPEKFKTVCNNLVEKYGKQIIQMLADSVDPHKICVLLKMCKDEEKVVIKDSVECASCKLFMADVEAQLGDNPDEDEIKKVVNGICDSVVELIAKAECTSFLSKNGAKIIQSLVDSTNPAEVCTSLELC